MKHTQDTPLVRVEDLTVRLRNGRDGITLVRGLGYQVAAGECLAIVGESGAGKSLGVRAALGLLDPRRFDVTGHVWLDGTEITALPAGRRRAEVTRVASLVFQDPARSLNPTMRVGQQITETLLKGSGRGEGLTRAQARERGIELLRAVGVAGPEQRYFAYPHELSGGMKQRIVIAIALACGSRVVFCDEPTSALDVTTQAAIMDLLDGLRAERGITTVVITHDLALAASRAQHILVMYAGQAVETLPAHRVAEHARMPYTQALIDAVPDPDAGGRPPLPIEGLPPDPAHPGPGCAFRPRCGHAREDCATERPGLTDLGGGHTLRCLHPLAQAPEKETATP